MMEWIVKEYTDKVNADQELKEYRDWIEANAFGFGERCFIWMWNEIVQKMPDEFTFMEIGVFRGQILGLIRILADRHGKKVRRIGITPLDTSDGHWESDYEADIKKLHDTFKIANDYELITLDSTNPVAVNLASQNPPDVLYIDGGHTYEVVMADLKNYLPILKVGATLVIDDCNNAIPMPWGYFAGIQSVSNAVDQFLPREGQTEHWKHELNLVHNRVLTKLK